MSDLELRLDHFRVLFAYHSAKIENETIACQDAWEIFENSRVVGYTGDPRTLFELHDQKVCYDFLKSRIIERDPLSVSLILEIHRILTAGAYDERRYIINGERPGEFKKHDYMTGKNEAGSSPEDVETDLSELLEEIYAIGQQSPRETGQTCREIGARAVFEKKIQNEEAWKLYKRAYKKYYARYMKGNMSEVEFKAWAAQAAIARDTTIERVKTVMEEAVRKQTLEQLREALNRK